MVRVLLVLALLYVLNPVMTHAMLRAALRSGSGPGPEGDRAMTYSFELVLVALVLATALATILVKDLISAVFILGSYSFFLALVWAWLGAVDLAFVEAVVGAGLSTVFLLLTLSQMRPEDIVIRRTPPPLRGVPGPGAGRAAAALRRDGPARVRRARRRRPACTSRPTTSKTASPTRGPRTS